MCRNGTNLRNSYSVPLSRDCFDAVTLLDIRQEHRDGDLNTFGSSQILRVRLRGALAMIRPPKKTNIPAVIFGFAVLATIGTASYAVMSRSIDKVP